MAQKRGRIKPISKQPAAEAAGKQFLRFKEMAKELESDQSPGAMDRAFASLDTKKKSTDRPAKRTAKRK
jgi:hypothetical protein